MTESRSSQFCGYPRSESVVVEVGAGGVAHVSGIQRCGSPWSCPVCAPVVREGRAREIETAIANHEAAGGGCLLVTLTLRHHRGDDLLPRLSAVAEGLGLCLKGAAWERRKKWLGYVGLVRSVEITWAEVNGWHAHVHAVLFVGRPVGDAEAGDLRAWLYGRWGGIAVERGFGTISEANGVDVRPLRAGTSAEMAGYLAKVEGGWDVGHEVARGDVKTGRGKGLVPVQLLDRFMGTGEALYRALWLEYERATFGKRAIVWSPGLRAALVDGPELTDSELAAAEGMDGAAVYRVEIPAAQWWAAECDGSAGDLLTAIEDAAFVSMLMATWSGLFALG